MQHQRITTLAPLTRNLRVSVLGGSGFVGQAIVRHLLKMNYGVRVISRHPERAAVNFMAGQVGQVAHVCADIRDEDSLKNALQGVDMVVNAVGILNERWQTRILRQGNEFDDIHHKAAARVAQIASTMNVRSLLHISALGADKNSSSHYAASKERGERAVFKYFPKAVVMRPSVVVGVEDHFFNLFAKLALWMPFLPVFGEPMSALWQSKNRGGVLMQPVFVEDVAQGVVKALANEKMEGKIIEAVGPKIHGQRELMTWIVQFLSLRRLLLPYPHSLLYLLGFIGTITPFAPFTKEQALMLQQNSVATGTYENLQSLGIKPQNVEGLVKLFLQKRFLKFKNSKKLRADS